MSRPVGGPFSLQPDGSDSVVGRAAELEALCRAVTAPETRLLTLTGPPGVGKTTLARTVAGAVTDRFGRTGQVDLGAVGTAGEAVLAISRALDLRGRSAHEVRDQLSSTLGGSRVLVLLDGCEGVDGLSDVVVEMLRASAGLRVVATSRERLHVAAERAFAVPPLEMPGPGAAAEPDRLAAVPSVALLVQEMRRVRPGFTCDASNATALARICVQLEGLPLALQVAAARLADFEPDELAVRLRNRSLLLDSRPRGGTGRHRTLRAAIGWSHDLLGADERAAFRRLSVFASPWSTTAGEAVVGEVEGEVLTVIDRLVERNLLRRVTRADGITGLAMLDSVREFAAEQLGGHEEGEAVRRRHREYYAALAAQAEGAIGTPDEEVWWGWLGVEYANLRAALASGLAAGDLVAAACLAAALGWFWYTRGHTGDQLGEVDRVLALADERADRGAGVEGPEVGGLVLAAAVLAWARADVGRAEALLLRAQQLAREQGDARRCALSHAFLGHLARRAGRYDAARHEHATAARLYQRLGNERGVAWSWHDLGLVAVHQDRLDEARDLFGRALALFEDVGYPWATAWARLGLGGVALRSADWTVAARELAAATTTYAGLGDLTRVGQCAEGLAAVALETGRPDDALRLLAAAGSLRADHEAESWVPPPAGVADRAGHLLGAAAARRVSEAGAAMSLRATLDLATSVASIAVPAAPRDDASPLTSRQRQVAALVARGDTNRQIARALGITEKTVEMHLSQIMSRLEVHNRAQVAAHAVRAGFSPIPSPAGPA
jgi:non-specific serine/threonine protein kinase